MATVLLSIALVARSRPIVVGAMVLAIGGIVVTVATAAGVLLPWASRIRGVMRTPMLPSECPGKVAPMPATVFLRSGSASRAAGSSAY